MRPALVRCRRRDCTWPHAWDLYGVTVVCAGPSVWARIVRWVFPRPPKLPAGAVWRVPWPEPERVPPPDNSWATTERVSDWTVQGPQRPPLPGYPRRAFLDVPPPTAVPSDWPVRDYDG